MEILISGLPQTALTAEQTRIRLIIHKVFWQLQALFILPIQGIKGLIDFDGFLLFATADDSQNQYLISDEAGYIIGKFGTDVIGGSIPPSPLEGEFAYPYNLAKVDNFVFCADSGNNRISMWKKNSLPVFDYPKKNYFEVRERQVLSFTVHAIDEDGDNVSYSGTLDPAGDGKNWGVNSGYMKFSMIPNYGDAGTDFTLVLTASDGQGSATMNVTIHVLPVNQNHKNLVKGKLDRYEDWVAQDKLDTDDGDLVTLKIKKKGTIEHWDGSVLEISGTSSLNIKASRSKKLSGEGYNGKMYGEFYATNEYTISSVAQLDEIKSDEELKKVSVAGTVGRILLNKDFAPLGTVKIKGGNLGGVEAQYIKNINVMGTKYKDVATKEKLYYGGNITHECYPGGYGRIKAYDVAKKDVSINGISAKGGDISNVWIHAKGHIKKVSTKSGKDELKMPVGGSINGSIIRAGVNPDNFSEINSLGDVVKVQVSESINGSAIIPAADPGDGNFEGTAIDPTEIYIGNLINLKHGKKTGDIYDSLLISAEPIKKIDKLTIDPTTEVIIDGVVQ